MTRWTTTLLPRRRPIRASVASKFDDLIGQLQGLKSQERGLVAKISFVGATPREVKEARRYLKALRKLAA